MKLLESPLFTNWTRTPDPHPIKTRQNLADLKKLDSLNAVKLKTMKIKTTLMFILYNTGYSCLCFDQICRTRFLKGSLDCDSFLQDLGPGSCFSLHMMSL